MSDPRPFPNDSPNTTESGFLFSDWELPEKSMSEPPSPFEGKIIARMPDLGSENFVQSIEKTKSLSYWEKFGWYIASMIQGNATPSARQRFFLRVATFGSVVLLCGIGILFLEEANEQGTENAVLTKNLSEIAEVTAIAQENPSVAPVLPAGANGSLTVFSANQTIPVASIENVVAVSPPPAANIPEQAESVWNRPAADAHSPWDVSPKQPADPLSAPITQTAAVAMSPMIDMSLQMSPYEQQLLAQANASAPQPVDPFTQQSGYTVVPPTQLKRLH